MHFTKYLACSLVPTAVLAHNLRSSKGLLMPRQDAPFAVDKVPESDNTLTRLEFAELMADVDAWNIYMLALTRFKEMDPSDPMSYFAISGIHSQPYGTWDKVEKCDKCNANSGYCHHLCVTFGFWHRPYIALFDRQLRKHAIDAALEFNGTDKDKYIAAAQNLLCPYWDWALPMGPGEPALPDCLSRQSVDVITPEGPMTIENPLWRFNFSKLADHSWIKNPASGFTTRDTSQITASWRRNLRANTWAALSSPQKFNSFGTESQNAGGLNPRSLEACHDEPHGAMGGDMAIVQNAAFDPAFMCHHCAVDRLLAIWTVVHPDEWMESQAASLDTRTFTAGTMLGPDFPLMPFRNDTEGNFWTANSARSILSFGYTYKGIGSQSEAAATMNKYYSDGGGSQKQGRALPFDNILGKLPDGELSGFLRGLLQNYTSVVSGSTVNEYTASIIADSGAIPNSFTVYLFDGDSSLPDSPAAWPTQPNILGSHNFLARRPASTDNDSTRVHSAISITNALLDRVADGTLSDMDEDTVQDYLHKNMKVRCVNIDSRLEVPLDQVPGFNVTIQRDKITLPTSINGLPQWVDARLLKPIPLPNLPLGKAPALPPGTDLNGEGGLGGRIGGGALDGEGMHGSVTGASGGGQAHVGLGDAIVSGLSPMPQGVPPVPPGLPTSQFAGLTYGAQY